MNDSQHVDTINKTLMERVAGGDADAFALLVKRYQKPILNFIYRFMGDPVEAEDLTQEVFLRVWKSAGTYRPDAKFTTWLYRIAANLCINKQRSIRIRRWFSPSASGGNPQESNETLPADGKITKTTPEDDLIQSEVMQQVRNALDTLPADQRLAVVLKIYDGLSYHEISQVLGRSVPAVESLLIRAKRHLRKNLSRKK